MISLVSRSYTVILNVAGALIVYVVILNVAGALLVYAVILNAV